MAATFTGDPQSLQGSVDFRELPDEAVIRLSIRHIFERTLLSSITWYVSESGSWCRSSKEAITKVSVAEIAQPILAEMHHRIFQLLLLI